MSKHKFKEFVHKYIDLENNRCFKILRPLITDKNLWHMNKYSVATGISLGVFSSWIPIPFHTILAIFLALIFDCNVPLAIISIWVANPLTMPEMYYFAYKLGSHILDINIDFKTIDMDIIGLLHLINDIWEPLILGCIISGLVSAVLVNLLIRVLWVPFLSKVFTHNKGSKRKK